MMSENPEEKTLGQELREATPDWAALLEDSLPYGDYMHFKKSFSEYWPDAIDKRIAELESQTKSKMCAAYNAGYANGKGYMLTESSLKICAFLNDEIERVDSDE